MSIPDPLLSESSDPITVGYSSNSLLSKKDPTVNNYRNTLLGTCINHTISGSTGQCNCTYPTTQANCFGYFVPSSESLCGATGMEGHSGGCCMYDTENNTIIPCQQTTYCGCLALASKFNFEFKWTKFLSGQSCKDIDCVASVSELGACCNGKGLCAETTESVCAANKMFFQGIGTKCIMGEKSICIEGTGGCCDGSTLELGVPGASCIDSGKIFTGIQRNAKEFYTEKNNLPCEYTAIPLTTLRFGDLVAGGMFIGIYTPGQSICYGRDLSSFSNISNAIDGSEQPSALFRSSYDWNGYAMSRNDLCEMGDSYAMILSLDDMIYDLESIYTPKKEIDTFIWSSSVNSWGPLLSFSGRIIQKNTKNLMHYGEGHVINQSKTNNENLKEINENNSCERKRVITEINEFENVIQSVNGRWSNSWGISNTMRINSSELFYSSGITVDSDLNYSQYMPHVNFDTETMKTMTYALREINRKDKYFKENLSSWHIPSMDQLAFIAYSCKFQNLNQILVNSEGSPLKGEYWSSTGSFAINDGATHGEGIYTGITAESGSVSWAMKFPQENTSAYTTKKDNRLNKKSVRLVRLFNCTKNNESNPFNLIPFNI